MNRDRLVSSTIMIALSIAGVFNKWAFLFIILALTTGGLYEFFYLLKKKGYPIYSYTGILIGLMIPVSIFFEFELTGKWEVFFMALLPVLIFILQLIRRDNANAVVGISTTLFGILYVSWFFSFLIKIRYMFPDNELAGMKLLGFILLVTKCGDMGALLVGSKFGKHPLLPRVSPNKTVEGAIGSLAASMSVAVLGYQLIPASLNFPLWHVALMGSFFGGLGQLGDISESLIKRDFNVKDSGNILPGMGGILDVIDSLLFSAPVFYFFIRNVLPN